LCFTNSDQNLYPRVPILAVIRPSDFVDTVLAQPPINQRRIFQAFKVRYENGSLNGELKTEKTWLKEIHDLLLEEAKSLSPIASYRLDKNIEWNIAPFLPSPSVVGQEQAGPTAAPERDDP
jgi:hypothetical protein